jgi:serine protease Do
MNNKVLNLFLSAFIFCAFSQATIAQVATPNPGAQDSRQSKIALPSFSPIVESAMPAVVNISTSQKVEVKNPFENFDFPEGSPFEMFKDFFDRDFGNQDGQPRTRKAFSLGSGFIIDPLGYIVTNQHVIAEAEEITVTLSGDAEKSYKAKLIGKDSKTDLALLKIETKQPLPFLKFITGDNSKVGDWVICIGNPFGLGGTVTTGIVSAKSRFIPGQYDDFIQTDASINRGNSGGPMLNLNGEVIGVNSVIISPSGGNVGIGLAIPSDIVQPIVSQLKEKGAIIRGWLGVKIQPVTDDIAKNLALESAKGALVSEVVKDSPADKAGVKVGDVITKFDGNEINNMQKLPRLVAETPIGKSAKVELIRDGKVITVDAKVDKPDDSEAVHPDKKEKDSKETAESLILGMKVEPLNNASRTKYKIDKSITGVMVTKVQRNSLAQQNGIKPGDVIIKVNRTKIETAADLKKVVTEAKKGGADNALFLIHREGSSMFFILDLD